MSRIVVLTYRVKHRKTFDITCLLKANGYQNVMVFAVPFHYIKKHFSIYEHRPEMNYSIPTMECVCERFGYSYREGTLDDILLNRDDIVLIGGAALLPDKLVHNYTIINAHPGYIPNCRGLDALKWAIVEKQPIGVTTHLLGNDVDAGQVIERRKIPVYKTDSFHALAYRVYENEVSMLVEAIEKIYEGTQYMPADGNVLHKRMPSNVENSLMQAFEEYKKLFAVDKTYEFIR